jgi:thiol-disulfide isomerase/thioredoxin
MSGRASGGRCLAIAATALLMCGLLRLPAQSQHDNPNAKGIADESSGFTSLLGKPFHLKVSGIDGSEIDAAKFRGKVVMVDLWATWCMPCRREIPELIALYQKYHHNGLEIIGMSCDNDAGMLRKFVKVNGMPWPECLYHEGLIPSFTPRGIPTSFLVNRKGDVAIDCSMSAYRDLQTHAERQQKREADIAKLLAE